MIDPAEPELPGAFRHWGGFLLAGGAAFLVDSAVLMLLTRWVGMPTLGARLAGIALAMVTSWLINRTMTFPVRAAPTVAEFLRFAGVAISAAALNYAIFAVLILTVPIMHPVLAVAIAALFAMVLSYVGMKFSVFRKSS